MSAVEEIEGSHRAATQPPSSVETGNNRKDVALHTQRASEGTTQAMRVVADFGMVN